VRHACGVSTRRRPLPNDPYSAGTAVAELVATFHEAENHPTAIESDTRCDLSAANHAETKLLICELAGIDLELALEIERSFGDLATYLTYPEVVDVVTLLAKSGLKIAVVSDFHVDLRPHLDSLGLLDHITGFALSCEVGAIKPDRAMFEAALAMVDAPAERCLMVGDNPLPDTGAVALGMTTLILPLQRAPRPPLLNRVLDLAL